MKAKPSSNGISSTESSLNTSFPRNLLEHIKFLCKGIICFPIRHQPWLENVLNK